MPFFMKTKNQSEYQSKLKHPQWQKKRLEILKRDKWMCKLCKDEETTLHVHHIDYESKKQPWEVSNENLVTLCEHCHKEVEALKSDNALNEIVIEKIQWSSGIYTMMVYAKSLEDIHYKIYDSSGKCILLFGFTYITKETHLKFFKKCQKLNERIEKEEIRQILQEFDDEKNEKPF